MRLKKIEIFGFKSFADKTVLEFHPGITAIVGPNGCGKSNISDSFRWVLGEQSAKSMRGNKMYDVIFSGTAQRKPLNMAEVSLTFTDVQGSLPTEFEEVTVGRRLYKDGESDYLINRRPVRLKDVYDLFLDTGVGKDSFSIFEQGKIDEVINLSPMERRYIFEEAAGISRFLQRKREALRRLEHTELNIERVRDIHQEVEKQIIILEEQAAKAKVYKENKAQLEHLEIGLFAARLNLLTQRKEATRGKAEDKNRELEQSGRQLEELDLERQNGNIRLNHARKELQVQREKVFQTKSQKEIKTKEWQTGEERFKEMTVKEQQWRRELDDMIAKRQMRQLEAKRTFEQQQKVEGELSGLEGIKQSQLERVHALEAELGSMRDQQHKTQKELLEFLQAQNRLESELKQTAIRIEHANDRKNRLQNHQQQLAQRMDQLEQEIAGKKIAMETLSQEIQGQKEHFKAIEKRIEEKTQNIKETQAQLDKIYQEKAEFKARQNVLFRLRDEMEGFSSGTKKLIQASCQEKHPLYNKLKGLYESLSPKEGGEMALSVVMRPYTQTLVVQTKEDLKEVVAYAKENKIRDFSILCIEHINQSSIVATESFETLLTKVQENILASHFLNQVYIANDSDRALEVMRQRPGSEAWTEEGIFIDNNQVIFYTSEGEENVFLREAELKTLGKKLEKLEAKRAQLEGELKEHIQVRASLQSEKSELDQRVRKGEMKVLEEKYALQRFESDEERTVQETEKNREEIGTLDLTVETLRRSLSELNQKSAVSKSKAEEVQKTVDLLNRQLEERISFLRTEKEDLQQKDATFQKVAEEKRKLAHQLHVFEVKDLESLHQEKRLEEEIRSIQEKQSQLVLNRVEYEQQIQEVERILAEVQNGCAQLEETVNERIQEIGQVEKSISEKREELRQKEKELHELGIQAAQLDSSQVALESELRERFHLNIEEAVAKEINLEHSLEKTEKEIRSLRRQLEAAGDINMTSIEEFDKYKERYTFLNQQIDDLIVSKEELIQIITQLDTESRKIFKETFEVIRNNFRKNYEILFRGGEADLQFTESADILEAGIEIAAKPPGKQMRSINLLSGGEKCLTAVALLFAIFEVKPAPFCILDEIDAPLDDTNVDRFLNVVKQFTDRCQFIIITHNKRTMSIADRLFGISMQEKGVSKILSLEFSQDKEPEPTMV